jgi:hypothetical protein
MYELCVKCMNYVRVLVHSYKICEMRHRNIGDRIWRPPFRGAIFFFLYFAALFALLNFRGSARDALSKFYL